MKFQFSNTKALAISCFLSLSMSACVNTNNYKPMPISKNVDSSAELALHFSTELIATTGRTRVTETSIDFSWPGVSFESEISSSIVGVRLMGPASYFNIYIDGKKTVLKTQEGEHDYVLAENLSSGLHTVRLVKRGETHQGHIKFKGWLTDSEESLLVADNNDKPVIQFFTDSFGVGLGNESASRECTQKEIARYTNHELAFPSLTAAHFSVESSSQSYSGLGMVRNYGGHGSGKNFTDVTNAVLLDKPEVFWDYSQDRADLIVIELGINDFSVKLNTQLSNEKWANEQALQDDWRQTTTKMITELRQAYGQSVPVIFIAGYIWPDDLLRKTAEPLLNTQQQADNNIYYLDITAGEPSACQWHPNVNQHQVIAKQLIDKIQSLKLTQLQ